MNDDIPKEDLCLFKDVLKCSVTDVLSEYYFSEAWKGKVIQCSNRRKDSLRGTEGSSSIQFQKKTATLLIHPMTTSTYLKRKCTEE